MQVVKMALNASTYHLVPCIYLYLNNTQDALLFNFHNVAMAKPYVVPNPIDFIAMYFEQFGTSNGTFTTMGLRIKPPQGHW